MFRRFCPQYMPMALPPRPPMQLPGTMYSDVMPPVMHQPMEYVKVNQFNHLVPHIHPINETIVNSHTYQDQHSFPHTYKVLNQSQHCNY